MDNSNKKCLVNVLEYRKAITIDDKTVVNGHKLIDRIDKNISNLIIECIEDDKKTLTIEKYENNKLNEKYLVFKDKITVVSFEI